MRATPTRVARWPTENIPLRLATPLLPARAELKAGSAERKARKTERCGTALFSYFNWLASNCFNSRAAPALHVLARNPPPSRLQPPAPERPRFNISMAFLYSKRRRRRQGAAKRFSDRPRWRRRPNRSIIREVRSSIAIQTLKAGAPLPLEHLGSKLGRSAGRQVIDISRPPRSPHGLSAIEGRHATDLKAKGIR